MEKPGARKAKDVLLVLRSSRPGWAGDQGLKRRIINKYDAGRKEAHLPALESQKKRHNKNKLLQLHILMFFFATCRK
jgi:hypothetical protein